MIAGDLQTARSMRLRLRFHERELFLEERHLSLAVGRGDDNDLLMKGHAISRLHANNPCTQSGYLKRSLCVPTFSPSRIAFETRRLSRPLGARTS